MTSKDEAILSYACEIYGECLGSEGCLEMTIERLIYELDLSDQEAEVLAWAAYEEWCEAYE